MILSYFNWMFFPLLPTKKLSNEVCEIWSTPINCTIFWEDGGWVFDHSIRSSREGSFGCKKWMITRRKPKKNYDFPMFWFSKRIPVQCFFLCLRDLCYNVLNFVNFIGFSCMLMYFGHVENQDQNSPRKWADIFMTRGACPNFWSQSRKTAACPDDVCRSSSLGTTGLKIDSMASTSFIWRMVVKSCTSNSVVTMKHYI